MYRICIYTCGVSADLYNWSFFIHRSLSQNITIRFFGHGSPPLRANSTIESLPRATPVAPALNCFPSLWKEYRPPRVVVPHSCSRITSRVLGVPPTPEFFLPNLCPSPTLAALGFGLWRAGESRQPSKVGRALVPAPRPHLRTCGRLGGNAPSGRSGWTRGVNDARSGGPAKLAVWLKGGGHPRARAVPGKPCYSGKRLGEAWAKWGEPPEPWATAALGSAQQSGRVQLARRPVGES